MASLNAEEIFQADWLLPRFGLWTLDAICRNTTPGSLATGTTVTLTAGDLTYLGTVRRGGQFAGSQHVRVVGGAGKLALPLLTPFASQLTTWRTILGQFFAQVGEVLAADSSPALLDAPGAWTFVADTAGPQLSALVRAMNPLAVWRAKPDGTIWIGLHTYPPAAQTATPTLHEAPEAASEEQGPAAPQLSPGTLLNGRPVTDVSYRLRGPVVESFVFYGDVNPAEPASPSSRTTGFLARFAADVAKELGLPFAASYPAKVLSVNPDSTLGVVPEDPARAAPPSLPIKVPQLTPGLGLEGASVPVEYQGADPSRPFIRGIASGSLAFAGTGSNLTITYTPPFGPPQVVEILFASASPVTVSVVTPVPPLPASVDLKGL